MAQGGALGRAAWCVSRGPGEDPLPVHAGGQDRTGSLMKQLQSTGQASVLRSPVLHRDISVPPPSIWNATNPGPQQCDCWHFTAV